MLRLTKTNFEKEEFVQTL